MNTTSTFSPFYPGTRFQDTAHWLSALNQRHEANLSTGLAAATAVLRHRGNNDEAVAALLIGSLDLINSEECLPLVKQRFDFSICSMIISYSRFATDQSDMLLGWIHRTAKLRLAAVLGLQQLQNNDDLLVQDAWWHRLLGLHTHYHTELTNLLRQEVMSGLNHYRPTTGLNDNVALAVTL